MRTSLRSIVDFELPAQDVEVSDQSWVNLLGSRFGEKVQRVFEWLPSVNQARFFGHALNGRDLLYHVGTSGGKTVTVMLWLLAQLEHHRAKGENWWGIVLLPTNIILDDFSSRLRGLAERLQVRVNILQYSGDTSKIERRAMRRGCDTADIILMTPDMYLKTLVSNYKLGETKGKAYKKWARKLLTPYVIVLEEVDELDVRALVRLHLTLKVLREKARRLNNKSFQTIATSATIPNGEEVAAALLERGVVIKGSGRRGKIHVWALPRRVKDQDTLILLLDDTLPKPDESTRAQEMSIIKPDSSQGMIFGLFLENKQELERLSQQLRLDERGVKIITGNIPKKQNQRVLLELKDGRLRGIGFTSIASRSLDIPQLRLLIIVGLPPRRAEFFQALGRVARNPEDEGYVYHLLDGDNAEQRSMLDNPEKLRALYQQGPPPIKIPDPSTYDVEQAVAIALTLGITERKLLETWFGPLLQQVVLRLRVIGRLAYPPTEYLGGPGLDEVVYTQGLRQMSQRFTVKTREGNLVGYLNPREVARVAIPGSLLALGQQVYRVIAIAQETVAVEPVFGALKQCYTINQLAGQIHFSMKARQQIGPATIALVDVHRFWTPIAWELRTTTTNNAILRAQIPTGKRVTTSQQGCGLYFETTRDHYNVEVFELVAAALTVTAFQSPEIAVERLRVGGKLILAERRGGKGLIEPLFEQLPKHLSVTRKKLQKMSQAERVEFLLPVLTSIQAATPERLEEVIKCLEEMEIGSRSRN